MSKRDIIAVLGPYSKEYNKAMFWEYNPKYCIMKDSGEKGGTLEKLLACEDLGIIPIVIGRESEEGIIDLDLVERSIRKTSEGGRPSGEFI
ncbi:MAG: precorrin-6A/cobalt-precorrin-6A reductase [Tissierellaceae bacterium]|nr:precorrin-6A/cobalt-precorrin-6A reductase [Tissierellaceae bacterium]